MTSEEHFRRLHDAAYTDLMRFVRRRVPDDEVDDIVSTVFMIAWRRLGELPGDAVPWLFGVARNVMAAQSRTRNRHAVVDVRMVSDDRAPGVVARIDLVRAWWTLSAADHEVLALVAFDGLTDTQAATVLGCRPTTYRMRLSRARRRLRDAMSQPAPRPAPSWSPA
ncbi:RNA polymerase sigma factor [Actinoplanes derwentensis]|uniref:RNA polymerase sigma-70 factor, ECF subfamily n=1 Tax=Actinoplanes derwentensis TaxID=113562 RepID=A0A1H1UBA5_9ACTN|nr:sigma factor-like helix-turn-helix DNA-binding protein [Actinoplanes derwentensis]GID85249.1 DNA-directed RNA polymerase sigma-70 factor [Actinoplanes derwentensis]SDS69516.1 RNA polymerase sigma-70 factor, ECF subfamily [Actinoplanes derwentensis]